MKYFLIGLIILVFPYSFWYFLNSDSYITIHDNLDSELVYIKLLLESGNLFGFNLHGEIPQIMNGLERSFMRSGFNFTFILFKFLPPVYAYITNHLIVHITGFVGMYLFSKKYLLKGNEFLASSISVCFGFVAYYHIPFGLSIAGQPLLLFAFLNLLEKKPRTYNWLIILAFPFYSFLPVTLPFFIPILLGFAVWKYRETGRVPMLFLIGIFGLCFVNVLVEFNLIYSTFFGDIVSHRTEFNKAVTADYFTYKEMLYTIFNGMERTHYHSGLFLTTPIIFALLLSRIFQIKYESKVKLIFWFIVGVTFWGLLIKFVIYNEGHPNFLDTFNLDRFNYLLPFLWLILLGRLLVAFKWNSISQKTSGILILLLTCYSVIIGNEELMRNYKILNYEEVDYPTYSQYYEPILFEEIKSFLGSENVKNSNVLCLGFVPNIAQFNGFNTLDSYQNNYSLEYKHEFRKIIKAEINRSEYIRKYFDEWGSRCYPFTLGLLANDLVGKNSKLEIQDIRFDFEQIKKMRGKYRISAVAIQKVNPSDLKLLKEFNSESSFWKFHVYEII